MPTRRYGVRRQRQRRRKGPPGAMAMFVGCRFMPRYNTSTDNENETRLKGQGPGLVNVLCVDANGRIVLMLFTIVQQTQGERGTERKKRLL